ncbi:MAG: diaminopimelate epimerase [Campylobacterales bacterium]|nr:diaminopimelate epimerase [Campylobacterales bacterium]
MRATKYNASGNDFIIFHDQNKKNRSALAKKLCDRHAGVGADGMVVLVPHEEYDFEWEFYNSDGSSALMCGNASRAVAHYANEKGISKEGKAEFLTGAGVIKAEVNGEYVLSSMISPRVVNKEISEDGESWWLIDTGVPHLVVIRDNIEDFDLARARALREKYNANVNIVKIVDKKNMLVRTYERGVENETLACGTGMVAAFVRAFEEGMVEKSARILPKSNEEIDIACEEGVYTLGGRVSKVFVAEIYI